MSTVLITGANRGVGLALATAYAQRGDDVIACCRDPAAAAALAGLQSEGRIRVLDLDTGSDSSVAALAGKLAPAHVDILINNAGVIGPPRESQSATVMDFAGWMEALNINTLGPVRVMQALLPQLRRSPQGKVMNITSQMGAISLDMAVSLGYCTSKAALNKFMRLAAPELKSQGIAVGLVHPGWVRTDMGTAAADISPQESAAGIARVIDQLSLQNSGGFWKWDGSRHDW